MLTVHGWKSLLPFVFFAAAGIAVAADLPAAKYKPLFEVALTASPGTLTAAYLRAYRSPTPDVAIKRWEGLLKEWAVDSIDDLSELTLLRQAHLELARLYYLQGRVQDADALLLKAYDNYSVYSVPEPSQAERWCKRHEYCK